MRGRIQLGIKETDILRTRKQLKKKTTYNQQKNYTIIR